MDQHRNYPLRIGLGYSDSVCQDGEAGCDNERSCGDLRRHAEAAEAIEQISSCGRSDPSFGRMRRTQRAPNPIARCEIGARQLPRRYETEGGDAHERPAQQCGG